MSVVETLLEGTTWAAGFAIIPEKANMLSFLSAPSLPSRIMAVPTHCHLYLRNNSKEGECLILIVVRATTHKNLGCQVKLTKPWSPRSSLIETENCFAPHGIGFLSTLVVDTPRNSFAFSSRLGNVEHQQFFQTRNGPLVRRIQHTQQG